MSTPFPQPMFVRANGIDIATYEAGNGPPIVLLHGFPELAFSWRYQIGPLAEGNWRAIAVDLRGYGKTGPQGEVSAYSMRNLSKDIIELLDSLGLDRAVLAGHDFGGALAWAVARDHSDRVAGVISLNTPYTRRGTQDLTRTMLQHRGPSNYMVKFQEAGVGEALLEKDVRATFRGLMRRPRLSLQEFKADARLQALPMTLFIGEPAVSGDPILSDDDLEIYVDAFKATGFTGPLNWYRNLAINWHDSAESADLISVPALMVTASHDFFLPPETTRGLERYVSDLEQVMVPNCGHWTQQEQPVAVNTAIMDWLERRIRPLIPDL